MKNTFVKSLVRHLLVPVLFASATASAAPVYYTFEGVVNWGPADDLGMIAGSSNVFGAGDTISMVWEVDLARPGEVVDHVNSTISYNSTQAYARLISGAMLSPADVGLGPFDMHKTIFNISGSAATNANLEDYAFNDGNNHHYFQVWKAGATVADYTVGATGFTLYERVLKDGVATRYQVLNTLTLTSISSTSPVPSPATWLIFVLGALGVAVRSHTH